MSDNRQALEGGEPPPETVDGSATEIVPARAAALTVAPQVQADELVARLGVIREAMRNAMHDGVDYGRVPGTDKPTLLKPGAEKLGVLFQLDIQLRNELHWGPGDHLRVVSHATVYHSPTGARLGCGEGICSTRERKYAYRKQERSCPTCGAAAVIKGREEFGGGWLCFAKRGGCGTKWPDGASEIEGQRVGEVDNPDLPDVWNTVVKMADKRARIDAVLATTSASAVFTQDLDDRPPGEPPRPHGPGCEQALATRASRALSWLLDGDEHAARRTWEQIGAAAGGYMPAVCAEAIVATARARREGRAGGTPEAEPRHESGSAADDDYASAAEGDAPAPNSTNAGAPPDAAAVAADGASELDPVGGEASPTNGSEPSEDMRGEAHDAERRMADEAMQIAAAFDEARRHGYGVATVQALSRLLYGGRGVEQLDAGELYALRGALASAHAGATSDAKLRAALAEAEQQPDRATAAGVLRRWLQTRARNRASRGA